MAYYNKCDQIMWSGRFSWSSCKGKGHPRRGHENPKGEYMYSCTLSLTSALDWGGWSTPRPSRFTPRKETQYPLCWRLGRPQGRSGWVQEISPPQGFDPRTVQPVTSRYVLLGKNQDLEMYIWSVLLQRFLKWLHQFSQNFMSLGYWRPLQCYMAIYMSAASYNVVVT
jgi:hypothetical protein